MANTRYFDLDAIKVTIYVRQAPSEERVRLFAELYTSSGAGTVPPILVTADGTLVDGRHRLLALRFLGAKGVVCQVVDCHDDLELSMTALKANVGGAKELTMAEVRRVIGDLLEKKFSMKKITQALPFPKEIARKLVHEAYTIWTNARVRMAAYQVRDGSLDLAQAAAQYRVLPQTIKKEMSRLNRKEELDESTSNMGSVKGVISQRYYSLSKRMGTYFKKLVARYEAGELTDSQMREAMAHVMHQIRIHQSGMNDWNDRMEVMLKTRAPMPMPLPMSPRNKRERETVTT